MPIKSIFILLAITVPGVFIVRTWQLHHYGQYRSDKAWNQDSELRVYDVGRIVERFGIPANAALLRSSAEYHERLEGVEPLVLPDFHSDDLRSNRGMFEWQGRLFVRGVPEQHRSVERGLGWLQQMEDSTPQLRPVIGPILPLAEESPQVGNPMGLDLRPLPMFIYDVADFTKRFVMMVDPILIGWSSASGGAFIPGSRVAPVNELIRFIEEMVDADSWRNNGGQIAAIHEVGGLIFVTQTPENHCLIQNLLKNLRKLRASIDRGDPIDGTGMDLLKP